MVGYNRSSVAAEKSEQVTSLVKHQINLPGQRSMKYTYSIEDLPKDLQLTIQEAWHELKNYSNPIEADGACELAADIFIEYVSMHMPTASISEIIFRKKLRKRPIFPNKDSWGVVGCFFQEREYKSVPHKWYSHGCRWPGHMVARVNEWYIDWTARQFHPDAPFPLIFHVQEK